MTPEDRQPSSTSSQIAAIVPCWNDGELLLEAVGSLCAEEGLETVVVDDCSTDAATMAALADLEGAGICVLRQHRNMGPSAARNRGLAETTAPYVFPLDSDDLAIPGALAAMRKRLESDPAAGICFGDYIEFGKSELVRAVPSEVDAYRLAFTNEYPVSALFRRSVLECAGGWERLLTDIDAHQDWDLWMTIAEVGIKGVNLGAGKLTYARRTHEGRLGDRSRAQHRRVYPALAERHPLIFGDLRGHRRRSSLTPLKQRLYPYVYGSRVRWSGERRIKDALDRFGLWTLTGTLTEAQQQRLREAIEAGRDGAASILGAEAGTAGGRSE